MKFLITSNAEQISRQFKAIAGMASMLHSAVDTHARACIFHAIEHNQPKPMNDLVAVLKHDQGPMNKWAVKYGPFVWQKGDKKKEVKAGLIIDVNKRDKMLEEMRGDPAKFTAWLKGIERFDELTKVNANPAPFSTYAKLAAIVRELDNLEKPENKAKKDKADLRGASEIRGLMKRLKPEAPATSLTH